MGCGIIYYIGEELKICSGFIIQVCDVFILEAEL